MSRDREQIGRLILKVATGHFLSAGEASVLSAEVLRQADIIKEVHSRVTESMQFDLDRIIEITDRDYEPPAAGDEAPK